MHIMFIFKVRATRKINWSERMLEKFHLPNLFKEDVPSPPPDYFTCTFQANKLNKYVHLHEPSQPPLVILMLHLYNDLKGNLSEIFTKSLIPLFAGSLVVTIQILTLLMLKESEW